MTDSDLFKQLLDKYGTHKATAHALGVTYRTYLDWRYRAEQGTPHHGAQWKAVVSHCKVTLYDCDGRCRQRGLI
jgi:hypothetical protein